MWCCRQVRDSDQRISARNRRKRKNNRKTLIRIRRNHYSAERIKIKLLGPVTRLSIPQLRQRQSVRLANAFDLMIYIQHVVFFVSNVQVSNYAQHVK